jgi:hypothetical protein
MRQIRYARKDLIRKHEENPWKTCPWVGRWGELSGKCGLMVWRGFIWLTVQINGGSGQDSTAAFVNTVVKRRVM